MFKKLLLFIPIALSIGAMQAHAGVLPVPGPTPEYIAFNRSVLAERDLSLTNRYRVPYVNDVFADNILLTIAYLSGRVHAASDISWDDVRGEQKHEIRLQPGEVFAFHDTVLAEFTDKTVATTNAHFNAQDGFRSSGLLYGDGVCHLASIINRVARDAGLKVVAPVNHDFAAIPDVPREYGTAIYYSPGDKSVSEMQNLYVENTFDKPVTIILISQKDKVTIRIEKDK